MRTLNITLKGYLAQRWSEFRKHKETQQIINECLSIYEYIYRRTKANKECGYVHEDVQSYIPISFPFFDDILPRQQVFSPGINTREYAITATVDVKYLPELHEIMTAHEHLQSLEGLFTNAFQLYDAHHYLKAEGRMLVEIDQEKRSWKEMHI